ncbi:MAG: hypothetical protein ABDI19_09675 [Armatimonadota bacterium]
MERIDLQGFKASLQQEVPPELPVPLLALWYEAKGDWDRAHQLVQNDPTRESAWVHAYLHRKEGDLGNARYWYSRANRPPADGSFEAEWEQIAQTLLQQMER